MQKISIAIALILVLVSACRKDNGHVKTPPTHGDDTTLYKVTTLMNVNGHVNGMDIADDGTVYYSLTNDNKVYRIKDSVNNVFAGGEAGYQDGAATSAQFNGPGRMATDKAGNLYVADERNGKIRKIDPAGNVSTMLFSYLSPVYNKYQIQIGVSHDTSYDMPGVHEVIVRNNHLYLGFNPEAGFMTNHGIQCRLDSVNFISQKFDLFEYNTFNGLDVTQDEQRLYWCNIYGIYTWNLKTNERTGTEHYDSSFPNFVLAEGDSVVYKPRFGYCIIERMSLATEQDVPIAGQQNNAPDNSPHASIDGVGLKASFNYIYFIKKKDHYLYIGEGDFSGNGGGKIRKMRVP